MTARIVLGGSVGLLVATCAAGGCGGRVDDAASGRIGEPPIVRILGTAGTGAATNSAGSGVGSGRAVLGGLHDAGSGSTGGISDVGPDASARVDAGQDAAMIADGGHEDPAEVWVGQVAHKVTSFGDNGPDAPPEHVVLALFHADGVVGGAIVFGNGPRPPKATDPAAVYPPITPPSTLAEQERQLDELVAGLFDGQPYSLFNVHRSEARMTFEVMPYELWKDWCALQPETYSSFDGAEYTYVCAPSGAAGSAEVGLGYLCRGNGFGPCECDKKSCHADLSFGWGVDLELRGDVLEGVFTYTKGSGSGIWGNGIKLRRLR
jgi:hypothetical protein